MLPSQCFETDSWRFFNAAMVKSIWVGICLRGVFDVGKYALVQTSKTQSNTVGIRQRSLGERHHHKTPYEASR